MDTVLWECLYGVKFIETYFDPKVGDPLAGYGFPRLCEHRGGSVGSPGDMGFCAAQS